MLEVFGKIKRESIHPGIVDLNQLTLTATQPGSFQDSSKKKFISVAELRRNQKGSINTKSYASMSTGDIMHSDKKRAKENKKINQQMIQKKNHVRNITKNIIVLFMLGYWLKF